MSSFEALFKKHPSMGVYEQITEFKKLLDYLLVPDVEIAQEATIQNFLEKRIDLFIDNDEEYFTVRVKQILIKFDKTELFLTKVLTYYRDIQYNGFIYSKYVFKILMIYKYYKDSMNNDHEQLFVDALYSHIVGLGDSELGYEFGGLETIRGHINILHESLITKLLTKYEQSSIHNFPFGWSYVESPIHIKQLKTIIEYSSLKEDRKKRYLYYYLGAFAFKTVIVQSLYNYLSERLGEQYSSVKSPITSLREKYKVIFKHNRDESKDIELVMNTDEEDVITYVLASVIAPEKVFTICQNLLDTEIRLSFKSPEHEKGIERFAYQQGHYIKIQFIYSRVKDLLEVHSRKFLDSLECEESVEMQSPNHVSTHVENKFDIAVVYGMKSGLEPNIQEKQGAVTFLDVLGWKGIYERRQSSEAINLLSGLFTLILHESKNITESIATSDELKGEETTVLSISDTIAIFTAGNPYHTLKTHGLICQKAIPESVRRGIPVRGATSYGRFSTKDNIMIGPAVDESASWHESTDWIGVIMTPTAKFELQGEYPDIWTEYKDIPLKKKINGIDRCVDWFLDGNPSKLFAEMGPHVPEIAPKYLNTLSFLNKS
jgi:hypothetical protein